jgi:hypothetical protein
MELLRGEDITVAGHSGAFFAGGHVSGALS